MAMAREASRLGEATVCRFQRLGSAAALMYWLAMRQSQYKPCIGKHANNSARIWRARRQAVETCWLGCHDAQSPVAAPASVQARSISADDLADPGTSHPDFGFHGANNPFAAKAPCEVHQPDIPHFNVFTHTFATSAHRMAQP